MGPRSNRLLTVIINPAMIVTWLAGIYLGWAGHWYMSGWLGVKFLLVLALSAVHGLYDAPVAAVS
jgi:putative membrane protein